MAVRDEDAAARRLGRALGRFARAEDGVLMVFGLFVLLIMMMAAGLAVDTIRHERERALTQATLDRAVLAAAALRQPKTPTEVVESYFAVAGLADALGTVAPTNGLNFKRVCADAGGPLDTMLLHLVGVETLDVGVTGCAEQRVAEIEISLVLDMSGSMEKEPNQDRLPRLKVAATEFVETVLADDLPGRRTTISIIPFASQVNAGRKMLSQLNVTSEHEYTHCVSFDAADFRETALGHSAADPLQRTSNFAVDTNAQHPDPRDRYCPSSAGTEILPWSDDASALKGHIAALVAGGGTSIDVGAKWGAALLDPSMRDVLHRHVDAGAVNAAYRGRPAAHRGEDVLKVMVVLSDGENYPEWRLSAAYRSGPSGFWVDPRDNPATETNYLNDRYSTHRDRPGTTSDFYHHRLGDSPDSDAWRAAPDGGSSAHQMSWPELFHRMSVKHFRQKIAPESYGSNWWTRYGDSLQEITASTKDRRTTDICAAAKAVDITVYTIGFEAPANGEAVLRACATSGKHHFDVDGVAISEAFRTIASAILDLRLAE